ncbi:MAG: hypothetical protein NVSMB10_02910 [Steroidobacteraceae bacterium]
MHPDDLRQQLTILHAELGAATQLDARSRALLVQIMSDITRLLDEAPVAPAAPATPPEVPSLPHRLEQIAVRFEADHPTLAASSRRLVDLLGKVGL